MICTQIGVIAASGEMLPGDASRTAVEMARLAGRCAMRSLSFRTVMALLTKKTKHVAYILFAMGLITVSATHAATFTVGPRGTLPTIQAGINAALLAGGSNEVHVQSGLYNENLKLTQSSGMLDISGGWNSTFTQQSLAPNATLINGGGAASVLAASVTGGELTFSTVSFVQGMAGDNGGGGAHVHITNTGLVQIRNSHFSLNVVQTSTASAEGGGIYVDLLNSGGLIFDGNVVANNTVSGGTGGSNGGGMIVYAEDSSNASISNSVIQNNAAAASSSGTAKSGGGEFHVGGGAQITVSRSSFLTNSLSAADASHASFSGAFVSASCARTCHFSLDQSKFDGNHGFGAEQLVVSMGGAGTPTVHVADTLVSRGDGIGVFLQMDSGTANVINLTIADNAGTGIYLVPNATITLYNTIAFGNASNLAEFSSAQKGNNLIGVDPQFVDAAHGNYHLMFPSPARDAGTAAPPGGLGLFDLDGNPRVFGSAPDIGAYEIGDEIFKNGFE